MSRNIFQVYTDNPATTLQDTDIFYLGRSPYGLTNDMGVLYQTIAAQFQPSSAFFWNTVTTNTVMQPNQGYKTNSGATLTLTLPLACPENSIIEVSGFGSGGWIVAQQIGQQVILEDVASTAGVGGSVSSTRRYDSLRMICAVANSTFVVLAGTGNPNFN